MPPKFIFVVGCFAIAVATYFFCKSKRDWLWLTLGLMFTVGADYFLVVRDMHLHGVAVFCFAHVCYIFRALTSRPPEGYHYPWAVSVYKDRFYTDYSRAGKAVVTYPVLALIVAIWWVVTNDALILLSGIYAGLFITNIALTIKFCKINKPLVLTGLVLFMLCDINVALFNLPRQFNTPVIFPSAFYLIWIFYLPSQLLLSASAIAFPKAKE